MRQVLKLGFFFCFLSCLTAAVWGDLILYYDFEDGDPNAVDKSGYGHDATVQFGFPDDGSHPEWETYPQQVTSHDGSTALRFGYSDAGLPGVTFNNLQVGEGYIETLAKVGQHWTMVFWCRQDRNTATTIDPPNSPEPVGFEYSRVISCPNYEIELGSANYLNNAAWFWPYQASPAWNSSTNTGSWDMYMAATTPPAQPIPPFQQWFHMAVTYDGVTLRQYVNGALVYSNDTMPSAFIESTWENVWPDSAMRIAVQASGWNRSYLVGLLDDVAIWGHAYLDADAVLGLYNGTYTPLTAPFITEPIKTPEEVPASFLFNTTFINEYNGGIILSPGQYRSPWTPWNWHIADNSGEEFSYGIENVSLWDGGSAEIVKYAAYVAPDVELYQEANPSAGAWQPIREDIRYNLKARVAGFNAVGNRVGVRFYKCSQTDPNEVVLIAEPNDTSTIITDNEIWVDVSASYTSDAADDFKYFKAVAYIEVETGPTEGTWGYFDSIVIDVDGPVSCTGAKNLGLINDADFNEDCYVSMEDFADVASQWMESSSVEPRTNVTELLDNPDFYEDIALVPGLGDSVADEPTGWQFVPDPADASEAGLWNLADTGVIDSPFSGSYQPAGGSVVVYIDPNTTLEQIASTPISNGTKYYLSAMVAGVATSYQNMVRVTWEYVDDPVTPTTSTEVAVRDFVLPGPDGSAPVWRKLTAEYTAGAAAAGKYFRARCRYLETLGPADNDWALIGYVSINTAKPAEWPRTNLLTNGDFEEVSNLPPADQLNLLATYNLWYSHTAGSPSLWAPGWTYGDGKGQGYQAATSNGLQCMLWAPPGQPIQGRTQEITTADPTVHLTGGRISIWLEANYPDAFGPGVDGPVSMIYQKVVSPTIEQGKTYYLDFTACSTWSAVNADPELWPDNDPNITVELYWVAPGQNDLTGTQGTHWGYITRAMTYIDNNLGATGGQWQVGQAGFTANSAQAGKHFFVRAFGSFPYATFEEIVLSEEPRPTIGAYTCYELNDKGMGGIPADLDGNCVIGIGDLEWFAIEWLDCVDPTGCP